MPICSFLRKKQNALAALSAGSLHADALKAVDRQHLLDAFSTVYTMGAVLFPLLRSVHFWRWVNVVD